MKTLILPPIGTEIAFEPTDVTMSKDQRTHVCRVRYDEKSDEWKSVPANNPRGMIVFLNDAPSGATHLRISKIQPTGKGAYADPVTH
jgi:hypothetical protein